jgi:hypothetical protein
VWVWLSVKSSPFLSVLGLVQLDPTLLGPARQQDPTLLLCLEVFWVWLGNQIQQLLAEEAMPPATILDQNTVEERPPGLYNVVHNENSL